MSEKYRVMTEDEINEVTEMVKEGLRRLAHRNKWMNQQIEKRREISERTQATRRINREAKEAAARLAAIAFPQAKETTK